MTAVIPGADSTRAESFAWYVLNHWGTGPGRLLPRQSDLGWHAYSEVDPATFEDRLQLESAHASGPVVTMIFVQTSRRLAVVFEPRAEDSDAETLDSLWEALTPLAASESAWQENATRIGAATFTLDPRVWPGVWTATTDS